MLNDVWLMIPTGKRTTTRKSMKKKVKFQVSFDKYIYYMGKISGESSKTNLVITFYTLKSRCAGTNINRNIPKSYLNLLCLSKS